LADYLLILPIRKARNTRKKRDKGVQNARPVSLFYLMLIFALKFTNKFCTPSQAATEAKLNCIWQN